MSGPGATGRPSISLIIPTLDRAALVVEAVESVLRQAGAVPSVELIVVDDGSTDGTAEALAPWRARIRYVRQQNAGQAAARNHGLQLARGDFVWFLDSDDVLLPGALATMGARVTAQADLDVVQGGWRLTGHDGETLADVAPWQRAPQLDLDTLVLDTPIFLGALVCRRERALRIGGFDETLPQVEDVDFVLRLALDGCRSVWEPRSVVAYRQHAGNITQDAVAEARAMLRVFESLFERPEVPERIRARRDEVFYYRYTWSAWRLCRRGHLEEAEDLLHRALACSALPPAQTVLHWARLFGGWSRGVGERDQALAKLLPRLSGLPGLNGGALRDAEWILPWWASIWSHYATDGEPPPRDAWADYERLPVSELLALVQRGVVMTPVETMNRAVERFLADAARLPLANPFGTADAVALHLTAFGQAALARRPQLAARAFAQALRKSARPGALAAWRGFAANAWTYARSPAAPPPERVR